MTRVLERASACADSCWPVWWRVLTRVVAPGSLSHCRALSPTSNATGWRDNGDSSGLYECPAGKLARDSSDGHRCSSGTCSESECCAETCAAVDAASCPAGEQIDPDRRCYGSACTISSCCFVGCQNWAEAGNMCPTELALDNDGSCDGGLLSGCNEEACCKHLLELKCQTQEAQARIVWRSAMSQAHSTSSMTKSLFLRSRGSVCVHHTALSWLAICRAGEVEV